MIRRKKKEAMWIVRTGANIKLTGPKSSRLHGYGIGFTRDLEGFRQIKYWTATLWSDGISLNRRSDIKQLRTPNINDTLI